LNQAVRGLKFPPELEAAVMGGLERERSKRFPSVDAFAAAFCTAARSTAPSKRPGLFSGWLRRDR
ncbi:MAG: hypothetical protein ACREL4_10555, partial [Gemmatimonadales bacterium]